MPIEGYKLNRFSGKPRLREAELRARIEKATCLKDLCRKPLAKCPKDPRAAEIIIADKVCRLLRDNTRYRKEAIAFHLGISIEQVYKAIYRLRAEGFKIDLVVEDRYKGGFLVGESSLPTPQDYYYVLRG